MGRRHLGMDVHHRRQQPLDELDRGIHESVAHASTPRRERATTEAESALSGWGQHPRQEGLDLLLGVRRGWAIVRNGHAVRARRERLLDVLEHYLLLPDHVEVVVGA